MIGQRVVYIQVSTFDQNPQPQLEGTEPDSVFVDEALGMGVTFPCTHHSAAKTGR